MKKFFSMIVVALLAFTASAQVEQGFRNGIRANIGMTNVCYEGDKMTFGYGVGWVAEYNFSETLFFQSGVALQNIAHKEDGIDGTLNAFYAQIPVHIGYRFSLGNTSSLFVQAGPTLGIGLYGSDIEIYGSHSNSTVNYFGEDMAKRFDVAVGGRVGVEFSKLQIGIGADYGVLKVFEVGGHNLNVSLGLAYMF